MSAVPAEKAAPPGAPERRDLTVLPTDLPRPQDDGGAYHLPGARVPHVVLGDTDGQSVDLAALAGRSVVFAYPRTGRPGEAPLSDDWDAIPGARGCSVESCRFRDLHAELTRRALRTPATTTRALQRRGPQPAAPAPPANGLEGLSL